MTDFYHSDWHFNHGNELASEPKSGIMKFCPETRPYSTRKEMNEHLIESINSVVKANDTLRFLGDFAFKSNDAELAYFFNSINCRNKILYIGNHDHEPVRRLPWKKVTYGDRFNMDVGVGAKQKVHINHHPFVKGRWDAAHHGTYHLFGHVHGEPVYDEPVRAMDVGVDAIGPVPISWEEIHQKLSIIPVVVTHHDKSKGALQKAESIIK